MNLRTWIAFMSFAPILPGCALFDARVTVQLESVEAVDWLDRDEMGGPGDPILAAIVGRAEAARLGENQTGIGKWARPLLKVTFTSSANHRELSMEGYSSSAQAYFCGQSFSENSISFPFIYRNKESIGPYTLSPPHETLTSAVDQRLYYFFY